MQGKRRQSEVNFQLRSSLFSNKMTGPKPGIKNFNFLASLEIEDPKDNKKSQFLSSKEKKTTMDIKDIYIQKPFFRTKPPSPSSKNLKNLLRYFFIKTRKYTKIRKKNENSQIDCIQKGKPSKMLSKGFRVLSSKKLSNKKFEPSEIFSNKKFEIARVLSNHKPKASRILSKTSEVSRVFNKTPEESGVFSSKKEADFSLKSNKTFHPRKILSSKAAYNNNHSHSYSMGNIEIDNFLKVQNLLKKKKSHKKFKINLSQSIFPKNIHNLGNAFRNKRKLIKSLDKNLHGMNPFKGSKKSSLKNKMEKIFLYKRKIILSSKI